MQYHAVLSLCCIKYGDIVFSIKVRPRAQIELEDPPPPPSPLCALHFRLRPYVRVRVSLIQHQIVQYTAHIVQHTITSPRHSSWTFNPVVLGCFTHVSIATSTASAATALKNMICYYIFIS
jgi:hypothetical protein